MQEPSIYFNNDSYFSVFKELFKEWDYMINKSPTNLTAFIVTNISKSSLNGKQAILEMQLASSKKEEYYTKNHFERYVNWLNKNNTGDIFELIQVKDFYLESCFDPYCEATSKIGVDEPCMIMRYNDFN